MKIKLMTIFVCSVLISIIVSGCNTTPTQSDNDSQLITIVTTTGMIADAVKNIGGELVEVSNLMGPGIDPHLYKASEGDVGRLSNAEIIFYNGLNLEAQMADVFQQMRGQIVTIAIAESVESSRLLEDEEYEGAADPHVWMDVSLWIQSLEIVKDTLIEFDPENSTVYETNAASYFSQLEDLHAYILMQSARIPEEQRVLITAHDAFQYFGAAYGFDVRGLQGISTESEAGTADIRDLAEFIVERNINAIFIETSVSDRSIQAVQAAVAARDHQVIIGGELYSDTLGSPDSEASTYIGMLEHNIDTIAIALLGE